ncbi:MAG: ATP-binding protein, partial [Acidobacteriota bacterium]
GGGGQEGSKTTRAFDLNIQEVLENWEVEHALREIIANALDEQVISNSREINLESDANGDWHVRDFGRGLRIEHFTLNENKEKLKAPAGVIGRFGAGLKDALATLHRRNVDCLIRSSAGTYRLGREHKAGFADIVTLHIEYDDTPNDMQGTEFIMRGVTPEKMARAKTLFLKFAGEDVLESTPYDQILRRPAGMARVYILGVVASEEPNFLFSYNVSSLTDSMKSKLNRERLNVGRTTYVDRVKSILKNARSEEVTRVLIDQVEQRSVGTQGDEMTWIEISQIALNLLNQRRRVAYVTEQEVQSRPDVLNHARSDGYQVVVVTEQQKAKLETQTSTAGPPVRTLTAYVQEYNQSFQYQFVSLGSLRPAERMVYDLTAQLVALVGVERARCPDVRISETMRVTSDDTEGVWDPSISAVVVKRSRLASVAAYAGTLLHEVGHATSGKTDATRDFERVLTDYLGLAAAAAIKG